MSIPLEKCTFRIPETLLSDLRTIAAEQNTSQNQVVETALKLFRDYHYMDEKATIVNHEIYNMLTALLETKLTGMNNKSNQVLSACAIELGTLTQVIAHSLGIDPDQLELYRKHSVEYLKTNQRVFRLNEIIDV